MALIALVSVITVPVLIMLTTCLLERVEATMLPTTTTPVLPGKPSPAPPSRRLTLVAAEAPEAPGPVEAPLPKAS